MLFDESFGCCLGALETSKRTGIAWFPLGEENRVLKHTFAEKIKLTKNRQKMTLTIVSSTLERTKGQRLSFVIDKDSFQFLYSNDRRSCRLHRVHLSQILIE